MPKYTVYNGVIIIKKIFNGIRTHSGHKEWQFLCRNFIAWAQERRKKQRSCSHSFAYSNQFRKFQSKLSFTSQNNLNVQKQKCN